MDPEAPLRVGDILYGFCGGWFKDSYSTKTVEAIGSDWVVAREELGHPVFAFGIQPEVLCAYRDKEKWEYE